MKMKNMKRIIRGLMVNGSWVTGHDDIKIVAWNFFATKFRENLPVLPSFSNPNFMILSDTQKDLLEAPFEINDIKNAIWGL